MSTRLKVNFTSGLLGADLAADAGAVTINFATIPTAFATLLPGQYYPLCLDPFTATPEIVWLTSYTAGASTGTIRRAQEDTTAQFHGTGSEWSHDPTIYDFPTDTYGLFTTGLGLVREFSTMNGEDFGGGTLASPTALTMSATGTVNNGVVVPALSGYRAGLLAVTLTVAGVGATSGQIILQGSLDGGSTWHDICSPDTIAPGDVFGTQYVASFGGPITGGSNSAPAKGLTGALAARTNGLGVLCFDQLQLLEKVTGTWSTQPHYTAVLVLKS